MEGADRAHGKNFAIQKFNALFAPKDASLAHLVVILHRQATKVFPRHRQDYLRSFHI
jgi:hypothetical protein